MGNVDGKSDSYNEYLENKEYWDNIVKNITPIQVVFFSLSKLRKCIWCGVKFPDGILQKHPREDVGVDIFKWFTPEFLVHSQTTHGYSPDIISSFLSSIS